MKSLCIDARMINSSGIGTYLQHIIPILLKKYDITLLCHNGQLEKFSWTGKVKTIDIKGDIYSIIEQLELPFKIPRSDYFWSPHYNVPCFPIRARKRVVTIHDVFHLAFYQQLSLLQKVYAKVMIEGAIRFSDLIFTVSEFSKRELIKYTGVKEKNVHVIHNGLDTSFFSFDETGEYTSILAKFKIYKPYLLFVGNIKPHKNLKVLVEAYKKSKYRDSHSLVLVGKTDGFITGDEVLINEISNIPEIILTGSVSNNELKALYKNAYIFVFPSLYEGFGFPPLEAMAMGCIVVCSNAASLPEICGDAALYFDPNNQSQLLEAMDQCFTDQDFCNKMRKKGLENIQRFSWEAHISQVVSLIETL